MLDKPNSSTLISFNKEICDFITRRFSTTDANWQNGNCYWFARILADRFNLEIYYNPIIGHFAAGYLDECENKWLFDSCGEVNEYIEQYIPLWIIEQEDPLWYERLKQYCID